MTYIFLRFPLNYYENYYENQKTASSIHHLDRKFLRKTCYTCTSEQDFL